MYDVVIAGGGPAGLSAALVLGRCLRRVVLFDTGTPRNAAASALHGYLTRDGIPPLELLGLGRDELRKYGIEMRNDTVAHIAPQNGRFVATTAGGVRVESRVVLLATGVQDHLPGVPGVRECYGTSVHHCPYCDGWEHRGQRIVVIGQGTSGAGLALAMRTWTDRITLCSAGPARLKGDQRAQLEAHKIPVREERLERVVHDGGQATELVFATGETIPCDAIFFSGSQQQQSDLPQRLGCEFNRKGTVKTDALGETCVPGVFVVGDASRDVQFVVVAAAEGAKAGVAINKALQARDGLAVTSGS